MAGVLVLPAASRPSISSRISLDPKILPIIFEIEPPMMSEWCFVRAGRPVQLLHCCLWRRDGGRRRPGR